MNMRMGSCSARPVALVGMVIFLWTAPLALAAPGDLDPSFADDGKVTTDFFGGDDAGKAVAIQKNGKIVVAGTAFNGNTGGNDFALVRYNRNGSLDKSFGSDGKVTTHFFGGPRPQFDTANRANALAIQSNGKIVVAGVDVNKTTGVNDFALLRYNRHGDLDHQFGNGGKVTTDFGGIFAEARGLALQPDGKMVVVGTTIDTFDVVTRNSDFALARYHSDGRLDTTFGTGGKVVTDLTRHDAAYAVQLTADGKILVTGSSDCIPPAPCALSLFVLLRYNADGTLDTSFGNGGQVTTNFQIYSSAYGVDIAPDGKIVVAGVTGSGCIPLCSQFAVARYNPDGSLDTGFGSGGKVMTSLGGVSWGYAVAIPDGELSDKIVVAGYYRNLFICGLTGGPVFTCDFALLRLNNDGSLDASFGDGGKVTTDFGGGASDAALALAIQKNGKIVLAGYSGGDFAVARYLVERCHSKHSFAHPPRDDDEDDDDERDCR
jgi:uncharacterized delta-60 repeat protein